MTILRILWDGPMLILSLIGSAGLLLAVNQLARRATPPAVWVGIASGIVLFVPPTAFAGFFSPAVAMHALFTILAAAAWALRGTESSSFLRWSLGAVVAAYAIAGASAISTNREYARLRRLFDFESMEARAPLPRTAPGEALPGPEALARMDRLSSTIEMDAFRGFRRIRLRVLHENVVALFINAPGFGVARMQYPTEESLSPSFVNEPPPAQPGAWVPYAGSLGASVPRPPESASPFRHLLDVGIVDFVNPGGFGYIKDRRHVAGFAPHRFRKVPSARGWSVRSLELVGLLRHDEPVVYVSDELPRMDRLESISTRPLDRFERPALEVLRQGEDLAIVEEDDCVRMLGAVRNMTTCIDCHGGKTGEILGAFSYLLEPSPTE